MNPNHLTIGTKDIKASVEFYTTQLNFEVDKRYRIGKPSEIVILKSDFDIIEFVSASETCVYESEGVTLFKTIGDLDEMLMYCQLKNIEILTPPVSLEKSKRTMVIKDRHGLIIELSEQPHN